MVQALEMMLDGVMGMVRALWATALALEVPWVLLALVLSLVLLLVLLLRRRQPKPIKTPQLLISHGDISQAENSALQSLTLKLSNLNAYPVQLLELALKTELMPQPLSIEAVELLPPHQAVELEAELPSDIVGDRGVVMAYLHAPRHQRQRATVYRLQASFAWEPWHKRYKVSPLGQSVKRARNLSSSHLDRLRKEMWLERNPHLGRGPTPAGAARPEPRTEDAESKPDGKKPVWDFPKDF